MVPVPQRPLSRVAAMPERDPSSNRDSPSCCGRLAGTKNNAPRQVRVIVPDEPPVLTPDVCRILLEMLEDAVQRQTSKRAEVQPGDD